MKKFLLARVNLKFSCIFCYRTSNSRGSLPSPHPTGGGGGSTVYFKHDPPPMEGSPQFKLDPLPPTERGLRNLNATPPLPEPGVFTILSSIMFTMQDLLTIVKVSVAMVTGLVANGK